MKITNYKNKSTNCGLISKFYCLEALFLGWFSIIFVSRKGFGIFNYVKLFFYWLLSLNNQYSAFLVFRVPECLGGLIKVWFSRSQIKFYTNLQMDHAAIFSKNQQNMSGGWLMSSHLLEKCWSSTLLRECHGAVQQWPQGIVCIVLRGGRLHLGLCGFLGSWSLLVFRLWSVYLARYRKIQMTH